MFVDGLEFFLVLAQLDTEGNIMTKFPKNPTSCLGGDAITRNVYRRTVGRIDGRRRGHRPYEKLLWNMSRRANNIKKGPSKGPSILDISYSSMPEPTGGLGGPLVPRPTDILSFKPVSEILNMYIISHA